MIIISRLIRIDGLIEVPTNIKQSELINDLQEYLQSKGYILHGNLSDYNVDQKINSK